MHHPVYVLASMTPTRFLDGRTALVTGSVRGLGLAIARGLAAAGCGVVLFSCGDAAKDITGATLPVDAGWSAR